MQRYAKLLVQPILSFNAIFLNQVDKKLIEGAKRLNTNVPDSKWDFTIFSFFSAFFVGSRYNKDLFYISPLYGKAFAKLEKIIFIDMDLDFYGEWF